MPEPAEHGNDQQRLAIERFAGELRELRAAAGNPSFRKLAGRSGKISHTTLHEAATGNRFASWETTREFVRACDGDETRWRSRWEEAAAATGSVLVLGSTAPEPPPAPGTTAAPATAAELPEPDLSWVRDGSRRPARSARFRRRVFAAAAVAAVAAAGGIAIAGWPDDSDGEANLTSTPVGPRIPGDQSRFITDVTIPDGTRVATNETFIKVWEIENSGTVPWHNRYLEREDLPPAPGNCRTPDRIMIGDTLPNQRVKISVTATAPDRPGTCMVRWKMVDDTGELFFPSSRPVFFLVEVVAP